MNRCDECGKTKKGVDHYSYPGGSIAQLCPKCATDCGFDLTTLGLIDLQPESDAN